MQISYIVPCYNVEKYVSRCIASLYDQQLHDSEFEVIAINDGSTDNTLQILKSLNYPNLRIIDQENAGLSSARNAGLRVATGIYVWFIDSDDYIKPNIVNTLMDMAIQDDVDILFFALDERTIDSSKIVWHEEIDNNVVMAGATAIKKGYQPNSVCSGLYKLDFLKSESSLLFYPKLYHQDVQFNYRAVALAHKLKFTKFAPYIYEIHSDSISQSPALSTRIKRFVDDAIIADSFNKFALTITDQELSRRIRIQVKSIVIGLLVQLRQHDIKTQQIVFNALIERNLFPLVGPFKSLKQRCLAYLFNLYYSNRSKIKNNVIRP